MKVLIYGAGSIGTHLSQAARRMNFEVTVMDVDDEALRRMREDIYPMRYGKWDNSIHLLNVKDAHPEEGEFDMIMIGTPPDSHMELAQQAIQFKPKLLHVEKPLLKPDDDQELFATMCEQHPETMVTVGYDHAISPSFQSLLKYIEEKEFGAVVTIDGATREHWEGIFNAHPWLSGPHDSYLGYIMRGGGAACEHSHALHLVLVTAQAAGWGNLKESCVLDMLHGLKGEKYDRVASFTLQGSGGNVARVIQDVITKPTEKFVRVQCGLAVLLWHCEPTADVLEIHPLEGEKIIRRFEKTRPDDFLYLMEHYQKLIDGSINYADSPIRFETGLRVMGIISKGL